MRVLLTGGYGCIGSWIVKNLLERGDKVWVYDLKQDLHRLELLLTEHEITEVIHLAGLQVPVCRADPLLGARVNVVGTLAVFEAVRLAGPQVNRLVYASSAAVFGPPSDYPPGPLADDVKLTPTTHYGVFKCANEGNARVYFLDHAVSSVGLRPWTVYGVGRDFGMTSEPTKAIKSLAIGRPYHISFGGLQDFQFVDDVARTFIRCLEVPYTGANSYNLRGEVADLPAFHRTLCEVNPAAAKLITYGEAQLPLAYDLDDSALQRNLGPMPRTPLVEGVRKTFLHFQQLYAAGRLDLSDLIK